MNRGDLIQKAVIVRDGMRTFSVRDREELKHLSLNAAKHYTRLYGCPTDSKSGNPVKGFQSGICVTGKGVIDQMRKLLAIKDQRELEARTRKQREAKADRDAALVAQHKAGLHKSYDEACSMCLEEIANEGAPKHV